MGFHNKNYALVLLVLVVSWNCYSFAYREAYVREEESLAIFPLERYYYKRSGVEMEFDLGYMWVFFISMLSILDHIVVF